MTEYRPLLLQVMADGVEEALARFDESTGRFITEPTGPIAPGAQPEDLGWIVTNQDIIYALATLYLEPGTRWQGDARLLEVVGRAGDAIRDFQDDEGRVEFIKPDGSRWGMTYMGWTNYAWLETWALLQGHLDDARLDRWREGLTLAHDGQAREIAGLHVHNIPCWKAMSCYRAGQLFGREDWMAAAEALIAAAVEAQQPGGYWAEHGGPTTSYNLVYVHALGLYHIFSGDPSVIPALEEAADFHQTFTYPDGSAVETVDGRVKYHRRINPSALVSLAQVPQGRRLVRYLLERPNFGACLVNPLASHVASLYHHVRAGDEAPINLDEPNFRKRYRDWALVWREGPWFVCASAFVCPPVASRWGQDRQSFLSVWHEDLGLVIGGGNSKDQPEWSSFLAAGRYLPDSGRVAGDERGVLLQYGDVRCSFSLDLCPEAVAIEAIAEGGSAVHQMVLRVGRGVRLRCASGLETVTDSPLEWSTREMGRWLQAGDLRIELPPGARLRWPSVPFNPYAIDGAAGHGSQVAILSAPIDGRPINWTLSA